MRREMDEDINWGSLFLKVIIFFVVILLIIWLFSKFVLKNTNDNSNTSDFDKNLNNMFTAAEKYYDDEAKLPKAGETSTLTLKEMKDLGLIGTLKDGKTTCSNKSSYAKVTNKDGEYTLKVLLTCGSNSNFKSKVIKKSEVKNDDNNTVENNNNSSNKDNESNNSSNNVSSNNNSNSNSTTNTTTNSNNADNSTNGTVDSNSASLQTVETIVKSYEDMEFKFCKIGYTDYYTVVYFKKSSLATTKKFRYSIVLNDLSNISNVEIVEDNYFTTVNYYKNFMDEKSNYGVESANNALDIIKDLNNVYTLSKSSLKVSDFDYVLSDVYEKDGKITRSEKPDCEVVSTVGAGDAFSAAFLVNYLDGRSVAECLKEAIRLASYVCTFVEAVPTFPMDDIRKWRAIYRLLNMVETEVYDCGELCGNACCMCRESSEDMGIYLLPGEHLILRESEGETSLDNSEDESWLTWEQQAPEDIGFPTSWGGPVYFVKCKTPPMCPRKYRPLQCRTFPLKPIIDENGVLEMIWEDSELPYICPIIEQNLPIHDSFYKATYTAWKHLLQDRRIMELVLSWSD